MAIWSNGVTAEDADVRRNACLGPSLYDISLFMWSGIIRDEFKLQYSGTFSKYVLSASNYYFTSNIINSEAVCYVISSDQKKLSRVKIVVFTITGPI